MRLNEATVNKQTEGAIVKTMLGLFAGVLVMSQVGFAADSVSTVPFETGPKYFKDGDQIVIQEVVATSKSFKAGDTVTVRGRYVLKSAEGATLALSLTTSGAGGSGPWAASQRTKIQKGSGTFELTEALKSDCHLHLAFYPLDSGSSFARIYFGTAEQMKEISDWKLSDK